MEPEVPKVQLIFGLSPALLGLWASGYADNGKDFKAGTKSANRAVLFFHCDVVLLLLNERKFYF